MRAPVRHWKLFNRTIGHCRLCAISCNLRAVTDQCSAIIQSPVFNSRPVCQEDPTEISKSAAMNAIRSPQQPQKCQSENTIAALDGNCLAHLFANNNGLLSPC